jgi:cell wall-associated NlpC family hydrolase
LSDLSPGDLIGWNWEGDTNIEDLDHVTLYLGNGVLASHAESALDVSATTFFQDGAPDWVWHLIHIFDSAVSLQSPQINSHGVFSFTVVGPAGSSCTIQSSTNLIDWDSLDTVDNTTGSFEFIAEKDPYPNTHYFYRVMLSP